MSDSQYLIVIMGVTALSWCTMGTGYMLNGFFVVVAVAAVCYCLL
jgi:hypothetical protein